MFVVILGYDADSIPSSDSSFPRLEEDYLYEVCFPVLTQIGNDIVIEYMGRPLSVDKNRTKLIKDPIFQMGQSVSTVPPRSFKKGVIGKIAWHFKHNAPIFFLDIDGKLQKSQYREEELRP